MKSKAMVLERFCEKLVEQEIAIRPLNNGEVLVKIIASGICSTDFHIWQGLEPKAILPLVMGHESVGIVEDINGIKCDINGNTLSQGDIITWNNVIGCGECFFCKVLKTPQHCQWSISYGVNCTGSFSNYLILHSNTEVVKLSEDIDPFLVPTISCSGAIIAHINEEAPFKKEETVAIVGSSSLAMFAVFFAKVYGSSLIVVIGGSEEKLEFCKNLGANYIINFRIISAEERKKKILELTDGKGVDRTIETVGIVEAVREAIEITKVEGDCILAGSEVSSGKLSIDPSYDVVRRGLRIRGIWKNRAKHIDEALKLVIKHKDFFERFITHKFFLENTTDALLSLKNSEVIKSILIP